MRRKPLIPPFTESADHSFQKNRDDWCNFVGEFFDNLRNELSAGREIDPNLRMNLQSWGPFVNSDPPPGSRLEKLLYTVRLQYAALRRFLFCIEQSNSVLRGSEVEQVIRNLSPQIPPDVEGHQEWAKDCIRQLNGHLETVPSISVPVALAPSVDLPDFCAGYGGIALLKLELVKPGLWTCFQDPSETLKTCASETFQKSIRNGWRSALRHLGLSNPEPKDDARTPLNGRWRVHLARTGVPLPALDGYSAGGAAALGWYHLLNGTRLDDRVIVLAACDEQGQLSSVGGIEAKVLAIRDCRQFDTIAVVSESQREEVRRFLADDFGRISIVDIASQVRSLP